MAEITNRIRALEIDSPERYLLTSCVTSLSLFSHLAGCWSDMLARCKFPQLAAADCGDFPFALGNASPNTSVRPDFTRFRVVHFRTLRGPARVTHAKSQPPKIAIRQEKTVCPCTNAKGMKSRNSRFFFLPLFHSRKLQKS